MIRSFRTASIRTQLFALAAFLAMAISAIAMLSEPFIHGRHDKGIQVGLFAGRVEATVNQFQRAKSPEEENNVLKFAAGTGILVDRIKVSDIADSHGVVESPDRIVEQVKDLLNEEAVTSIRHFIDGYAAATILVVRIDDARALAFRMPEFPAYVWVAPAVASGILKIVIPLFLLAYFSSRLIIEPVIRFTGAARRVSKDDCTATPFEVEGAAEIRSLARSLNLMRSRIQQMVEDRTRMLSSISHDLRTPLTRLRMRVERSSEPSLRQPMLADISTLGAMIDESMALIKNTSLAEVARNVDLSSLLQTIATDFSDTGVDVGFKGPRRATYICRPQGITRTVSNLVENASRYATRIEIELHAGPDGGMHIWVRDNGPGLTEELKQRVMEPFFKADEARAIGAGSGFGLGLPIAQSIIQKGHNGTIRLLDRKPKGLCVEIYLPPIRQGLQRPKDTAPASPALTLVSK